MNDQEKIDAFDKRKLYLREYAKFKYHNDPEYRKKQIKNQKARNEQHKQYYHDNKERIKMKKIYNEHLKANELESWKDIFPEDHKQLLEEKYIFEDLSRNPKTMKIKYNVMKNQPPSGI